MFLSAGARTANIRPESACRLIQKQRWFANTTRTYHSNNNNTMPMTNMNSSVLNASTKQEINPLRLRLTATTETTKATGAVENIKLGPSQVSGWPQQKIIVSPTPTSGIARLRSKATPANMPNLY